MVRDAETEKLIKEWPRYKKRLKKLEELVMKHHDWLDKFFLDGEKQNRIKLDEAIAEVEEKDGIYEYGVLPDKPITGSI